MIPTIKKILYATDMSKNSPMAFLYAIASARAHGAQIVGLHVVEPAPEYAIGLRVGRISPEEDERRQAVERTERRLDAFCQEMDSYLDVPCHSLISKTLVRIGYPVEVILDVADEETCDVIVLGSHSKGIVKQTFLGSVSQGVLQRSRKPVYIIPIPSDVSRWQFMLD
jgi:nucleotide-binding universal stress UspA family protein